MIRSFLALPLPDDLAQELFRRRAALRRSWKDVRWIPPSAFHITLVFFGSLPEDTISLLPGVLNPILTGWKTFPVELCGVGSFGSAGRPKVLFETIRRGGEALCSLREALRPALEPLVGWEDGPFRPHVSLGRPRRGAVRLDEDPGIGLEEPQSFNADRVVLFRSDLSPKGALYTPLEAWKLGGTS